ncbi:Ubiquitin carboxyl-terminal hydrolase 22 [Blattella germanica]|nr:Ubiquitin carboxyl-terminal hydrolase 22 [Blattella germanica]
MSDHGCIHLNNFKAAKGIQPYRIIHAYFVACTTTEARIRKALACFCHTCNNIGSRLHSCLHCIFFGCYVGGHIQEHAKLKKHFLAVDLSYGTVLCFQCGDYVYDKELSTVAKEQRLKAAKSLGLPDMYNSWLPNGNDVDIIIKNPKRRKIVESNTIGLRGLLNLGNTCFMNCIVQALTHTPLLRDFFLSDRHLCQFQDEPGRCLVCEVSRLFQEFYSGNKAPLTLHRLLHLIWTHARHLAGYEQQDAHEFFIAALDVMHRHCKESNPLPTTNPHHCNCIIDQIFTGGLQSDVVCQACNGVSTTIDPFWDISLDLGPSPDSGIESGSGNNDGQNVTSDQQTEQERTSLRFEHSSRFHKKIKTFVAFPEHLDMTPFMSHRRNHNNNNTNNTFRGLNSVSVSDNRYSLFAVINHLGSLDAGHYTAFIRQQRDHWFKCDDHLITRANLREVLDSEGYVTHCK